MAKILTKMKSAFAVCHGVQWRVGVSALGVSALGVSALGVSALGVLALVVVIAGVSGPATAHKNATGIVKERMDKFSASQRTLKQMAQFMKAERYADIAPLAGELVVWAGDMPTYFPAGSDASPSEAAPAIWTDFAGFQAAAAVMADAARGAETAAAAGDGPAVKTAIAAIAGSCKSCHRAYRAR